MDIAQLYAVHELSGGGALGYVASWSRELIQLAENAIA